MNFTKTLTGFAAVAAGLGLAAQASALTIDGVTLGGGAGGSTFANSTLWESQISTIGDELKGIGIVESIAIGGSQVFANAGSSVSVVYVVEGFTLSSVTPLSATVSELGFTGGSVKVYSTSNVPLSSSSIESFGAYFRSGAP